MEMGNVCIIRSAYMFLLLIDTTQTNVVNSSPEITLDNAEQDFNNDFIFNVSCTASKNSRSLETLTLQCDHVTDYERPPIKGLVSITVTSVNKAIDCECIATYFQGSHFYNRTLHKLLFAENVTSKLTFYITSLSENGTNITVWENQRVSFECLPYDRNMYSLSLQKGTKFIKNAFFNFSYRYTIDHVQCNDSGEYRCFALSYKGVNSALVTLSVQCATDKCVDNEVCRLNRSVFPTSCSNTSWHSNLCSTGLPTRNAPMTLTNDIVIFVTIPGTFIVIGLVIFFLAKARGYRIKRRYDDIPIQEAIVQRDITPTPMESNENVYIEINKNHPPHFDHGECSDYLISVYVPWEPTGYNAEIHQNITLSINQNTELSEN